MQTSNAQPSFRSDDPVWVLLAEFSLSYFVSEQDPRVEATAGYLFQTVRELGMSPECMENIISTLAGFAKAALARTQQGWLEFPGQIRVFCQTKMIDDANSAKTVRPDQTEPGKKRKLPDPGANTIGAWGYFMIERGEALPPDSSAIPHNDIDLYLYKEAAAA